MKNMLVTTANSLKHVTPYSPEKCVCAQYIIIHTVNQTVEFTTMYIVACSKNTMTKLRVCA